MNEEYGNDFITLTDEDGNEKEFEMIDALELDGEEYVALIPACQEPEDYVLNDNELVILKVFTDESGEDLLITIEEEAEFDRVAEQFERRLEDEYEFDNDGEIQ